MTSSQTWHKRLPAAALERARRAAREREAKTCMPIKVPDDLPARSILSHEGVHLIKETAALRQDIRALRFLFVNLMPDKIATETQFARLLGNTPLQVEVVLLRTSSYLSKHVSQQHLLDFYREWDDVREEQFDAMIVTGAPVELMEFEDVDYWEELSRLFSWSERHVLGGSLFVCWSAQAALYARYGVAKRALRRKLFGLFPHRRLRSSSPLLSGFGDAPFPVPVSRHTETRREDLPRALEILIDSDEAGMCLLEDEEHRSLYLFNHFEYDADTLAREYRRDLERGVGTELPRGYFPADNIEASVANSWRPYAQLLISNWIGEVYRRMSLAGALCLPDEAVRKVS